MRTIQISTKAFAKIWSHRADGEEDENAILERLLGLQSDAIRSSKAAVSSESPASGGEKILWRDDVRTALQGLGGEAALSDLYVEVRRIRLDAGRSLPLNTEAIIRRELENNSSSSNTFTGRFNWFRSVNGLGSGVWAIREANQ